MSRTLRFGLLWALLCAAVSACISPPNFSDTPRIKFEELKVIRLVGAPGSAPIDSDTVIIYFEDGNGDLGLSSTDIMEPYNEVIDPVTRRNINPNYNNYYIQPQIKEPGSSEFVDFVNPPPFGFTGEYDSRYPRLGPDSEKEAPLKGYLKLHLPLTLGSPFNPGTELRFRVSIKDRALNQSNEIFTESYIVQPR